MAIELGAEPLSAKGDAPLAPQDEAAQQSVERRALWVAVTGGVLLTTGLVVWTVGLRQSGQVQQSELTGPQRQAAQDKADHNSLGGASLVVVGACVLGMAAVMWQSAPAGPTLTISPTAGGGAVILGGTLP